MEAVETAMDENPSLASNGGTTPMDTTDASLDVATNPQGLAVVEQNVFVAFQGGGARGVVHVGGLRALEDGLGEADESDSSPIRLKLVGVAGTSAGSIVAALVASGRTSDDLYDPTTGDHLLSTLQGGAYRSLTGLFTRRGWNNILRAKRVSSLLSSIANVRDLFKYAFVASVVIALTTYLVGLSAYPSSFLSLRLAASLNAAVNIMTVIIPVGMIIFIIVGAFVVFRLRPGLAPLTAVKTAVDEAIRLSLPNLSSYADRHLEDEKYVTFKCLKSCGGLPLRIVATDLTRKDVRLFSYETTPNVAIADAVCASIGLPYIFKPHRIDIDGTPHEFADGGFLSNLPLWAFDDERAKDPDCWSIGMSIKSIPKVADEKIDKPSHWSTAILDAIVSGPSLIHRRGIDNLMMVDLPSSLDLLDFDKGEVRIRGEISRARTRANKMLHAQFLQFKLTKLMHWIDEVALENFNSVLRSAGREERKSLTSRLYLNSQRYALLIAGPGSGLGGASLTKFPLIDMGNSLHWRTASEVGLPTKGLWSVVVRLKKPLTMGDAFVSFHSLDLTPQDLSAITGMGDDSSSLDALVGLLRGSLEEFELALAAEKHITREFIFNCGV
ncbi:TPA: patatin-like phospholipase family protein [Stenotrophomonas maltophilia]